MRLRLKVSLRRNTERAKAQSALAESDSTATKGLVELRLSADARGAAKARGAFRLQSKKLRINTRGYYGRFRRRVGREAPKRCSPRGLATESPRLPCGKVDSAGDRRLRMGRLPCDSGDPSRLFRRFCVAPPRSVSAMERYVSRLFAAHEAYQIVVRVHIELVVHPLHMRAYGGHGHHEFFADLLRPFSLSQHQEHFAFARR